MARDRDRKSLAVRREERAAVEDPAVVMAAAARLLEGRARSVFEVRRRLTQAGYRESLVEPVIDRLLELEILDDEAFARAWVASRDRAHPRGERALRMELRMKGIGPEVIAAVLQGRSADRTEATGLADDAGALSDSGVDGDDPRVRGGDQAAADLLLARNDRSLRRVSDPRRRRQRAWALLARGGFDSDTASEAIARAEPRWSGGEGGADEAP